MRATSWAFIFSIIAMRSQHWGNTMTSLQIREQVVLHLLTPKNCALLIIDYRKLPHHEGFLAGKGGPAK